MKTTLNEIRKHGPCESGWTKLLVHLGKTRADDEPVSILTILDSNGLNDAIWCLRAVSGHDREIRLFAVWCARQVEHLNNDPRVKACNDTTERFAHGLATEHELTSARVAVLAAAEAADGDAVLAAARVAARAAARAAAWVADGDAAWVAVLAAAGDAAGAAAWVAAGVAAWAAARSAQEKELRRICEDVNAALAKEI